RNTRFSRDWSADVCSSDLLAIRAKQEGSPIDIGYPKEGVPVITEPVGIVKSTQNPEAARAFVDFLLSREGQQLAADMGYMPLRRSEERRVGQECSYEL